MKKSRTNLANCGPFSLNDAEAYTRWRAYKLAVAPRDAADVMVEIGDPCRLSDAEKARLLGHLRECNLVFYHGRGVAMSKEDLRALGRQLGLERLDANICADEDSITSLQVVNDGRHAGYIPYTNRRLSWHTDGYYNAPMEQIRAIVMHCVRPAAQGGENAYLDHEILYLLLRDRDPDLISALMHPQVMSIPPNVDGGDEIRGVSTGPVFSLDEQGNLHMRYSARTRNISWRDDAMTAQAVATINEILASDSPYIVRDTLQANEGVISNNVLHNRSAFTDDANQRLLYRARYYDRVSDTNTVDFEDHACFG